MLNAAEPVEGDEEDPPPLEPEFEVEGLAPLSPVVRVLPFPSPHMLSEVASAVVTNR